MGRYRKLLRCRSLWFVIVRQHFSYPFQNLRGRISSGDYRRYAGYLQAVAELDALAQKTHDRNVLALAVRWVLDKGAIALWGARHPGQLDSIDQVFGWSLSSGELRDIDEVVNRNIPEPVGPEFMAPPK